MGLPRHATLVLFSDWLRPVEETKGLLAELASLPARGELVQILDPAEIDLPYAGRVRFSGIGGGVAESQARSPAETIVGRVETVRDTYRQRLEEHQARMADLCRATGFGWQRHRTDQPPGTALLALYNALSPSRGRR